MAAVAPRAGPRARLDAWVQARRAGLRARATARDAGEVELSQRRVYILPTRPGLGFTMLLLALLIGSINYSLGLGFALTFVAGACGVVDMVATTRNLARLRLSAGRADAVFAGEDARFAFQVANPTRLARYAVRLDLDHVREPRHALDVAAGGAAAVVVQAPTTRRGWLRAPRVRLSTSFPLGLFRAWSYWQPDSRALVYPFPETGAPPLPLSGQPSADGFGNAGGDDFAGVRSYQAGDPLRHLAWRQIARLDPMLGGQLVTKQFDGGVLSELVLDFDALPRALDVELRLSRLARWVLEAEGRALPYAFRLGSVRYDAALGPAHQAACLGALALYGAGAPMKRILSRDKEDTLLLIGSTLLVLVPHAAHLPPWVSLLCGATLAWRAFLTLRGRRMPPNLVLAPLAVTAMAGVLYTYHTLLGKDAGVAMLVLLVAFKMLEMHARRDLFVVIFLCFFLVLTNFFYSQSIGTAALMLASLAALLTTQLSFQMTGAAPPLRTRLLMGAKMLGLAAPLAAAAFVLFPRVEGPLWGMPEDAHGARGGLTDTMAPGQVSNLAQSDDVAFRVRFDGAVPAQPQLYWRGPVLARFDGRTWTRRVPRAEPGEHPLSLSVGGTPVRYQVTLEPSHARWIFALEMPRALPVLPGHAVLLSGELEIQSADPLDERVRYDAASFVRYNLQADGGIAAGDWLQLPPGRNPRALAEGRALQAEPDPARRVQAVLHQIASEGFVYTLQPPLLPGRDAIDDFLFGTRAGFCEHYAGAFVFLMRAAGVPARVVTGYQGGDLNPVDGYLVVRQSDAHAWAEVWLPQRGWVRVDPTAAAAPERIRRSLARALPPPAPFGLSSLGALMQPEPGSLLARVRYVFGAANNGWNQWVLNYGPERQRDTLARLEQALLRPAALAVLALAGVLLFGARKLWLYRKTDPVDRLYSALCQRLAQLGVPRAPDEGPTAYAARVAARGLAPEASAAATEFLRRYSAWRYGRPAPGTGLTTTLKDLLSRVR